MAKEMGEAKSYRMDIGYNIITEMERDDELPLPNKNRLCKVMNEYFIREGFEDKIKADGYLWTPDSEYWSNHLTDLCGYMRIQYRIYFAYIRNDGEMNGLWKFTNKGEWEKSLKRDHQDIATRVDNHNDKIDDSQVRWNIAVPRIAEIKRLAQ